MSDFSRRDVLKGTGAATVGTAMMTGTATAETHKTPSEVPDIKFHIWGTRRAPYPNRSNDFYDGVLDGVHDLAEWCGSWLAYFNSEVIDHRDHNDYLELGDHSNWEENMRDDIPDNIEGPGHIHLAIISTDDSEWHLGHARNTVYATDSYDGDGKGGAVCYVNSNHARLPFFTGYKYGYNTACHEIIHTLVDNMGEEAYEHGMGSPDMNATGGKTSIMSTGYTSKEAAALASGDAFPEKDCFREDWDTYHYWNIDPQPAITRCTAYQIFWTNHDDGSPIKSSDMKTYTYIDENEKPW